MNAPCDAGTSVRPPDRAPSPRPDRGAIAPAAIGAAAPAAPGAFTPAVSVAVASAVLAGCASGDASTDAAGGTGAAVAKSLDAGASPASAARFLLQASTGATDASLARVQALGIAGWIDEQLAMPRGTRLWDWMVSRGFDAPENVFRQAGIDAALWRSLIASDDTLRQRVALALSEILVVGIDGLNVAWRNFAAAAYFDLLLDHAFGNYRALLRAVSTSPAMGVYLTFRGNAKANPDTGSLPDENYARELMQLFTIGLTLLNDDGTPQTAGGAPLPTYGQADIMGLARVFTGWDFDSADRATPARMGRPMAQYPRRHETGEKAFLGVTIPAGTPGGPSLDIALDTLFAHPNLPPFVSRQLIQRLVTSNPSGDYVRRVSAVFANNGAGVRGDLAAVVRAILLDPEARDDGAGASSGYGKLREPILRFTNWARACNATSATGAWSIPNTSDAGTRLGQSPLRSNSVFNFFRPGYVPPGSEFAQRGMVAPEFQITNESSVIGFVNYMQAVVSRGAGDVVPDYAPFTASAATPAALVERLNRLLAGGQLSPGTANTVASAIADIPALGTPGALRRVRAAVLLVLASPECSAQK